MAEAKTYSIILGIKYDAEILGRLESVEKRAGYIKELIRKDISGELNTEMLAPDKAEELILQYVDAVKEKYGEKYLNNSEKTVTFPCNRSNCADIISRMDSMENKSEYVKKLILMDMGLLDSDGNRIMLPGMDGEEGSKRSRKKSPERLEQQRERLREYARRYMESEENKAAHREAQKRYMERKGRDIEENYQIRSIRFNKEEDNKISEYCEKHNIKRNTLIRKAVMKYIEKSI